MFPGGRCNSGIAGMEKALSALTGTIARVVLRVDRDRKYTADSSKTLETSLSLAAGSRPFKFYGINTADSNRLVHNYLAKVKGHEFSTAAKCAET